MVKWKKYILLLTSLICLSHPGRAQGISEYDRLRLENNYLRQKNDSLRNALYALQSETVYSLWDALTGLSEDRDSEYDYNSGFGLQGTKLETEFMRKVMGTVPSLTLPYDDVFEKYIDLYTVSRKKSMPYVLGRYKKHQAQFRQAFITYGVPEELTLLSVVESAVSRKALSKAGAYGMWQLMPETARQYGLLVNEFVDERLDVEKSTVVAAKLLRDLKRNLGTWELAVLAYNCGSGNVRKAIIKAGGARDVWAIYRYLPAETRAYLPSLVGARFCQSYAGEYNIEIKTIRADAPVDKYTVSSERSIQEIADAIGADAELLAEVNCQYLKRIVPAGMSIAVPKGAAQRLKDIAL